jgi:hypothetical protein
MAGKNKLPCSQDSDDELSCFSAFKGRWSLPGWISFGVSDGACYVIHSTKGMSEEFIELFA